MSKNKHILKLFSTFGKNRGLLLSILYLSLSVSIFAQSSATFGTPKEHDEDNGTYNSLVQINDSNNTYLLAFTGYGGQAGYLKSFTITKDGNTITPLTLNGKEDFNFDSKKGIFNSLVKLNSDIFVLAYTGVGDDGWIKTLKVSADGKSITVVKTEEHDKDVGQHNSLIKLDENTVVLAYYGKGGTGSFGGYIKAFNIATDGSSITETAVKMYKAGTSYYNKVIKVDSNTLAVASHGSGGWIETLDIAADKKSFTEVKNIQFEASQGTYMDLIEGESGKFITAYHGNSGGGGGMISTFSIAGDGAITHESKLKHNTNNTYWNRLVKVSTDVYALM